MKLRNGRHALDKRGVFVYHKSNAEEKGEWLVRYWIESELHANGEPKRYDIYREHREAGFRFRAHIHSYYEIIYCQDGCMEIVCGEGERCRLNGGDLIVIDPNVIHATAVPEGFHTDNLVVKFSPAFFYPEHPTLADIRCLFTVPTVGDTYTVIRREDPRHDRLVALVEDTCEEFETQRLGYELILRANAAHLYALLLRYSRQDTEVSETAVDARGTELAARALSYLEKEYDRPITMAEAAEACHVRYSYFSRHFSEWAQMKFNDYLSVLRVNKARRLLLQSELSVTAVAMECGFDNPSYFIKKFRQLTGLTPVEFRMQYS